MKTHTHIIYSIHTFANHANTSSLSFIYSPRISGSLYVHVCFHLHRLCVWLCGCPSVFLCAEGVLVCLQACGCVPMSEKGTLTRALCGEHFSPSSVPLLLPSYRRLGGGCEGGRCSEVGGRERGRSTSTHQSFSTHLKTTAEILLGRFCMSSCIYTTKIKNDCACWLYCQSERSNNRICRIIHEKTQRLSVHYGTRLGTYLFFFFTSMTKIQKFQWTHGHLISRYYKREIQSPTWTNAQVWNLRLPVHMKK